MRTSLLSYSVCEKILAKIVPSSTKNFQTKSKRDGIFVFYGVILDNSTVASTKSLVDEGGDLSAMEVVIDRLLLGGFREKLMRNRSVPIKKGRRDQHAVKLVSIEYINGNCLLPILVDRKVVEELLSLGKRLSLSRFWERIQVIN